MDIEKNKQEFIELIKSINREGFDSQKLIDKLENSDFFTAPASSKYHLSVEGGLCQHSLNVYRNLLSLSNMKFHNKFSDDTLKIVGLLHDISKMNYYELTFSNKKVYHEMGTKKDNGGAYDWVTVSSYKTKEPNDRFIFGNHEMTSEFMVRCFIPLTVEESVAILHYNGGKGFDSAQENMGDIYNAYPLALLLHTADMLSCYVDENV